MKFKKFLLPILLALVLVVSGCSGLAIPTNADAAFENFTLQIFQEDIASSTLGLHYTLKEPEAYGITQAQITLGDFPTDGTAALVSLENLRASLNQFSYRSLSKENQLTYDVLSSYIETATEGAAYTLFEEPLSSVTGIHAQLPVLLAEYTLTSEADVVTYLDLLKTLPDYYSSLIAFETAKAGAGLFMPNSALEEVIEQCNGFLAMGESNYLFSTFAERLEDIASISAEQRNTYIEENRRILQTYVLPAYRNLISSLSALKGSTGDELGLCYLPEGKDYYQHLLARETGSSRTPEEVLALVDSQIADDVLSIQKLAQKNPSITEETAAPISEQPEQMLDNLQHLIADAFPEAPDVSIDVKYVPEALEPHLSPAFYLVPAIDSADENVIYINDGQDMDSLHLFTTLAHEGYPGHLYQTTYYANTNPDPLRSILNYKGYVEGWATYAEMCAYSLSSLEKTYASMLQKNNSLILGLHARADLGIHYEGWDVNRTMEFFKTYGITDESTVQEIYNLILADPANYPAYYVGYLEILELKKAVMKKEGETFSQKEFHKRFLEAGPAPFDVVKKQLNGT